MDSQPRSASSTSANTGDGYELPIFPLGSVLYPEGRLPLRIFEPRYVEMAKACLRDGSAFGICLILDGYEAGAPAVPHAVGCTARILDWDVRGAGAYRMIASGERVFRIRRRWTTPAGLVRAEVAFLDQAPACRVPAEAWNAAVLLRSLIAQIGEQHFSSPFRFDDCAWVAHRLAELLQVPRQARQKLLETRDPLEKIGQISLLIRTIGAGP